MMMKLISRNSLLGITLTELLIASVMVCVVMMGIVSLDSVVAKKRQIATAENLLTLNTRATVTHILRNAAEAVGYGSADHQGILIGEQVGDQEGGQAGTFCIEQDTRPFETTMNVTPMDDRDDRWACYTLNQKEHNIYFCQKAYDAQVSYRGAGRCTSGEIVGRAIAWEPKFDISNTAGAVKLIFSLKLTTRFNPDKPKSSSNPESTVTVNTSPAGHGIR